MGRGCRGSGIWQPTWKPSGVGFSVWLSSKASEENRSMSWMTKGGSSSALGQSPPPFPLNELARGGVASTRHEVTALTCCDRHGDGRWARQAARTTKGTDTSWTAGALGRPPERGGVYPSEGFC